MSRSGWKDHVTPSFIALTLRMEITVIFSFVSLFGKLGYLLRLDSKSNYIAIKHRIARIEHLTP